MSLPPNILSYIQDVAVIILPVLALVLIEAYLLVRKRDEFMVILFKRALDYYKDYSYLDTLRHSAEFELISFEDYMSKHPIPWLLTDKRKNEWVNRFTQVFPELTPYLLKI